MPEKKRCPACDQDVTVNPSGALRKHHDPARNGYVCDGLPRLAPCPACQKVVSVDPTGTLAIHTLPGGDICQGPVKYQGHCVPGRCTGCCGCSHMCAEEPCPQGRGVLADTFPVMDKPTEEVSCSRCAGLCPPGVGAILERGLGWTHIGCWAPYRPVPVPEPQEAAVSEAAATVKPMTAHTNETDSLAAVNALLAAGPARKGMATSSMDAINALLENEPAEYTNASGQPKEKTNRYGYLVTDPDTGDYRRFKNGNPKGYTRCTTFVKTATDTTGLTDWKQSNVLRGAAMRPDIAAAAHGKTWPEHKRVLLDTVAELEDIAGAKNSADEGTLVHELTERIDAGEKTVAESPSHYRLILQRYVDELVRYGLEPVSGLIERTILTKRWNDGVSGTFDRIYYHRASGTFVMGDVKTGRNVDEYGRMEIPAQMMVYADGFNTYGVFDWNTRTWVRPCVCWLSGGPQEHDPDECKGELIRVREDWGVILHMPLQGDDAFTVTLKWADLEEGAKVAEECARIRAMRSGAPKFAVLGPDGVDRLLASPSALALAEDMEADDAAPVTPTWAEPVADPWSAKFKAVTTRDEANVLYRQTKAAGANEAQLRAYVEIGKAALLSTVDTIAPSA